MAFELVCCVYFIFPTTHSFCYWIVDSEKIIVKPSKNTSMKFNTRLILPAILLGIVQSPAYQCFGQAEKALLHVTILDEETQQPTPARVHVTKEDGSTAGLPPEAISVMYGRNDLPEGYGYQPDSSFYVDGEFSLALEPGDYFLTLSRGVEYLDQVHQIQMDEVGLKLVFTMERWIHMADSGWYSGDEHIHIRRSPRENPYILKWIAAEDIHVGALLQMGDFRNIYFGQFTFGDKGVYSEQDRVLSPGQEEPRTHQVGHTIALMADEFVRYRDDYYYYVDILLPVNEVDSAAFAQIAPFQVRLWAILPRGFLQVSAADR